MTSLEIAAGPSFATCVERWRAMPAFTAIDGHPVSGGFGRCYYPAVFDERRTDASFAVMKGERPLLIVPCTSGEGELDYFGMPIRLFADPSINVQEMERVVGAAFVHLDSLVAQGGIRRVSIRDDTSTGTLSPTGKQCLNRHGTGALRLTGICDLGAGEAGMRQGLRKSFQSLINWGKRNLAIKSVSRADPDRDLFERYRQFHAAVAGRVTRPEASWNAMFDWIARGGGELVLGFLAGGELVTGTLVVDGTSRSYYASGVYDRTRFDQPLGHWPLWLSMLHAMERGIGTFELGDLPLPDSASEKEFSIGYFKRGFATSIKPWISWTLVTDHAKEFA